MHIAMIIANGYLLSVRLWMSQLSIWVTSRFELPRGFGGSCAMSRTWDVVACRHVCWGPTAVSAVALFGTGCLPRFIVESLFI